MNLDTVIEQIRKATTVLDAAIGSDQDIITAKELRCVALVAHDYLLEAMDELDPLDNPWKGGGT